MRRRDRGESLIEVVVATGILGLLGLTIVGSIALTQPLTHKVEVTSQSLANLNSAAEQIQLQGFKTCSPNNPQPYGLSATNFVPNAASAGGLNILTAALPLAQAPSAGTSHAYSATLTASGGNGTYSWSVSPRLPSGLSLSSSGVITGSPLAESSQIYKFTVSSGGSTASKNLPFTVVSILVQVNDSTVNWAPCQNAPLGTITGAVANGSTVTYTYSSTTAFSAGDVVTISGITPSVFNQISVPIVSATATTFVVASNASGTFSSGGVVGLTKSVNVQQILLTTSVGTKQLSRTIVAAI